MRHSCFRLMLVGVLLVSALLPGTAVVNAAPDFSISVSNDQPAVGSEVKVRVIGRDVTDVYAAELQVSYDVDQLQFKSASGDPFDYAVPPIVNGGQLVLAFTKVGPVPGESGTFVLAELVFEAKALGKAEVELHKVITVDSSMEVVETDVNAAVILSVVPSHSVTYPIPPGDTGGSGKNASVIIEIENGKVVIRPSVPAEGDSEGRVVLNIDASIWSEAVALLKEKGVETRTIQLALPEAPGSRSYSAVLPPSAFGLLDESMQMEISTPVGTVIVPGHMFGDGELPEGDIEIRIEPADAEELSEELRGQIGSRPVLDVSVWSGGKRISWSNPYAPVTIRIPYRPTAEETANSEHITVWYIDAQGRAIAVPSGRYDSAAGTVVFQTTHLSKFAVVFVQKTFHDLEGFDWAKAAVEVMASKGIIQGVSATQFRPGAFVSRADFAVLLARTMDLRGVKGAAFADVAPDAYYADAVAGLRGMGIAQGTGNNEFRPHDPITRQDMMVLISRALEKTNKAVPAPAEALSGFIDADAVAEYARDSVAGLVHAGLVKGSDRKIHPAAWASRAEAAVLMHRLYNYIYP